MTPTSVERKPAGGSVEGLDGPRARLASLLIQWLESGVRPRDLFAVDVFADLTVPLWRLQVSGADATFHLREDSHPFTGQVNVQRLDATSSGLLIEFDERWSSGDQRWYCREMIHCLVADDRIQELRIYCSGDWDEAQQRRHAAEVTLIRP